jgi:hypothetical protein
MAGCQPRNRPPPSVLPLEGGIGRSSPRRFPGGIRGPPYENSRATAAGLAAQLLKWHFVLAEPIAPLLRRPFSAIFTFENVS